MDSDSVSGDLELQPMKLDPEGPAEKNSWLSLLTLDYYQSYFDVSTAQVVERIIAGMFPIRSNLVDSLHPNPDLYGPFWLAVTMVLSMAISGNISNLLDTQGHWEFHFHEITLIGCCVYTYTWFVPFALWMLLWWRGNRVRYTLLQLLAIYGYSIGIFTPLVILWIIRSELLRWILWALSTLSSGLVCSSFSIITMCLTTGSVLVISLWKPMKEENSKLTICILVLVFILHAGLSAGFKLYYFNSALAPLEGPVSTLLSSVNVTSGVSNHSLSNLA